MTRLLVVLLLAACTSSPERPPPRERLLAAAEIIGDAMIRTRGTELIKEHAVQLMPLLDEDGDQIITLADIKAASLDPVNALILLVVLQPLLER